MATDKEFDDAIQQPAEPMIRYRITDKPNQTDGRWEFNNASSDDKEWHPFSASKEYAKDNIFFTGNTHTLRRKYRFKKENMD